MSSKEVSATGLPSRFARSNLVHGSATTPGPHRSQEPVTASLDKSLPGDKRWITDFILKDVIFWTLEDKSKG
jgi:hypothetical protein